MMKQYAIYSNTRKFNIDQQIQLMSIQIQVMGLEGSGKTSLISKLNNLEVNGVRVNISEDMEAPDLVLFCQDGNNLQQLPASKQMATTLKGKNLIVVQTKADLQTIDSAELKVFLGIDCPIQVTSTQTNEGINELKTLIQEMFKMQFSAEPRVVHSRNRYQNDKVSKPQQTFNKLMQDTRVKMLPPMAQEQEYIRLEKERIKMENMHQQLQTFQKKLKNTDTYDIKVSDNPRISVNLEFFLTDTAQQIKNAVSNTDTQTDAFRKKPESPKYVPKKTGIDEATQVEDYELFDFDREVTPILDVICTKTLEQACMEIEQEEEFQAMNRFKENFDKKRAVEKQHQVKTVTQEKELIQQKIQILNKYRERQERIERAVHKAQAKQIAIQYLKSLQVSMIKDVNKCGFYPDEFQNDLNTKFLDWLVDKTVVEVKKIIEIKDNMKTVFDNQFDQIPKARLPQDQIIEKKKRIAKRRMINYTDQRCIRLVYQDSHPIPTLFSITAAKYLDGSYDEWRKTYDSRIAELEGKLDANEMQEEEYLNTKRTEYPDVPEGYFGLSVNFNRLAFSFAHDQYYVTKDRKFEILAMILNRDGSYEIIDKSQDKVIKMKQQFRQKLKQSDDECIQLRLLDISSEIVSISFMLRLQDVANNTKTLEWMQNARFGLYDSEHMIPFSQLPINRFKFEDLLKVPEDPEQAELPQTAFFHCFTLQRRYKQFGQWYIEQAIGQTKGLLSAEIQPFFEKFSAFALEQYELTLERDKALIMTLIDRERESLTLSAQEKAVIITKQLYPSKQKQLTLQDSQESGQQIQLNLDEPVEQPKNLFFNTATQSIIVNINDPFEVTEQTILNHLQTTESFLVDSFKFGLEIQVRNRPFLRPKQLIRIRSIDQMTIIRTPEPPPAPVVPEEEPEQAPEEDD